MRVQNALAVGILLGLSAFASAQQPAQVPPRDQSSATQPAGMTRIQGRVIAADTGAPLRRAGVRVTNTAQRNTRITTTDAEGRFDVRNLTPGRYTITVNKAGYVSLQFGQRRPFEGGRPLDLTSSQEARDIDFALPKGGVIYGRLIDQNGDPIVGAHVQAMRYVYRVGGRRTLTAVGQQFWLSNTTNDLGEFRLFGLMPGTYIVAARAQNRGVVSLTRSGPQSGGVESIDSQDGFINTYYPGTANPAEAAPVTVTLAEETQVSFSLITGRMSRVSGVVRQSDGRPPAPGAEVRLRPRDVAMMGAWGQSNLTPDGNFTLANVPPGEYILEATPGRQVMFDARSRADAGAAEFARVPLTAGGSDVTGVVLSTRPGATVSGRVVYRGKPDAAATPGQRRIVAIPVDPNDFGQMSGEIDAEGRFTLRHVTGVTTLGANLPPGLVIGSISANGTDITDRPHDATNGDLSGVEVTIVASARVVGTARNARGEAIKDFRVAYFPSNRRPGTTATRYVGTTSSDPNGRFELVNMTPGEYIAVAVESLETGGEWDPAFQQRALPAGRRFTAREGQSVVVDLPFLE